MLLIARSLPEPSSKSGVRWWCGARFNIAWQGYVWYPGHREGEESIAALARELHRRSLAELAPKLKGIYGLFVYDAESRSWQITGDTSGLFRIYYSDHAVSTRFLDLSDHLDASLEDLVTRHLVEYLAHGAVLGAETFLRQVRVLRDDEILSFNIEENTPTRVIPKASTSPGENPDELLEVYVRGVADSLRGRRLSVDLTGGLDSRVLVCLCSRQGLPFETAISGREDNPDVTIARRIAEIIGREFHCTPHRIDRLDEELPLVFDAGDAHTDTVHFHRDLQNAQARLARGVALMMHGGGGEIYRDHSFVHEFPRYGSRHSNLERLYRLRVCPLPMSSGMLTNSARRLLAGIEGETIQKFEKYVAPTNNQTCERIYLHLRMPEFMGVFYSNYIHLGLDVLAPFFDREIVEGIMRTSPWSRFFALWHRRFLTQRCPTLSRLPTMDGVTASALWSDILRDSGKYAAIQLRRAGRKVTQRWFRRSMFYNVGATAAHHPDYIPTLLRTETLKRAIAALKEVDILAADFEPAANDSFHLGRILTAGLLLDRLRGSAIQRQDRDSAAPLGVN